MKTILALLALTCTCLAQKAKWPPTATWYSVQHRGWPYTWSWTDLPAGICTIQYPRNYVELGRDRDIWVNQIMTRQVQGDIRGRTINITATLVINAPGRWYFNGYRNPADYGTAPVRARLFMLGYDALYAQVSSFTPNLPDLSQWGSDSILLPETAGTYTLSFSVPLTSDRWTNVNGQRSQAGLDICAGNVKQIGICIAGGNFYSVGVGQQDPAATITINSFSVQ